MSCARFNQLVLDLAAYPSMAPLASSLFELTRAACREGDTVFPRPGARTLKNLQTIPREAAVLGEHDVWAILNHGAQCSEDLDVLTIVLSSAVKLRWAGQKSDRPELARLLLWLETYTGLHCLSASTALFDAELQRQLSETLLEVARQQRSPLLNAEFAICRAWLSAGAAEKPSDASSLADPLVIGSSGSRGDTDSSVAGELGPKPRHPATVAIFAVTGVLFLIRAIRGLGRLVLRRRAPTSIWLSDRGLELFCRQEILGRVIRERRVVVPIEDIRCVEREVRFPRFGLYAGLIALGLGTLLGTRLFVEGLRVAGLSFPLIAIGLVCVIVGVLLDMALSGVGDSVRGRCRLVVIPRRGAGWAIGDLDPDGVDRLLNALSTQLAARG